MAYASLSVGLPVNFLAGSLGAGTAWGSSTEGLLQTIPSLPRPRLGLWSGSGSKVGLANLMTLASGTLINTTPGTTDTADIDLSAALDAWGASKSYVGVCELAVLCFSTTDADYVVVGGASGSPATNPWTAPFVDMATPANGRLRVKAGYVDPNTGDTIPGFVILYSGNTTAFPVSGSSKILRLYSPSSNVAGVPYRVVLAGRDA